MPRSGAVRRWRWSRHLVLREMSGPIGLASSALRRHLGLLPTEYAGRPAHLGRPALRPRFSARHRNRRALPATEDRSERESRDPNRTLVGRHSRWGSFRRGRSARSMVCWQVEQRPVQQRISGWNRRTAWGRVRPAAGDLGSAAPGSGTRARRSPARSGGESRGSCGLRSGPTPARL